ncbi:MAG: metallophosphoesterase [Verrucomicrobiota bacterium]
MQNIQQIYVFSDVHYAGPAERQRGASESGVIASAWLRLLVRLYRRFLWRRDPFAHNHLLDEFLVQAGGADFVIGNGDYSCDSAFIGVADAPSEESAQLCLERVRARFGSKVRLILGDHELGKMSLFGGRGGLRLASWERAQAGLRLEPFWRLAIGQNVLLGVTSSLLAFPIFEPEALPSERAEWRHLREGHLEAVRQAFDAVRPGERVLLFCHDPTALPFLWAEETVRAKAPQLETTVIGHLHSELFLWKSRLLSGMPAIPFLGNSIRRMSVALHQARTWRHFRVRLCPALAGIELLKDGGYCVLHLDPSGERPLRFERRRFGRA